MNDVIKTLINELISYLKNPNIKGKQAAFNACFEQLTQLKKLTTWETIVEIIKSETSIELYSRTASNMYGRAKRKLSYSTNLNSNKTNDSSINYYLNAETELQKKHKNSNHDKNIINWHNVDVRTLRLITDFEDNGITPEEVKKWNLPNDPARRKKLTEILNRRGK